MNTSSASRKRPALALTYKSRKAGKSSSAAARSTIYTKAGAVRSYAGRISYRNIFKGFQTVVPERLRTWLCTPADFYIAAGNSTAAAGNYMSICVNSIYQPFNTTYYSTLVPGATFAMNGNTVQGFTNATEPMGYTALLGLYEMYKVLKWKLEVTVLPQGSQDSVRVVVLPVGNEQIPSVAAGNVNLHVMEGQPNAYAKTCNSGSSPMDNKLTLSQWTNETLGKRIQQWMDLDGSLLTALPSTNDQAFAGLFIQQVNGANNTNPLAVQIRLFQYIEFTDQIQQIN